MRKTQDIFTLILLAGLLTAAILCLNLQSEAGDQTTTNDEIYRVLQKYALYKKPHSVMQRQYERIQSILTGFLMGDTQLIEENASAIQGDLHELVLSHFPEKEASNEEKAVIWKSVSEIANEAEAMHKNVQDRAYDKAYTHYTNMTVSCIRCHQTARSWGKFFVDEGE